jgi:hypothetical protein
VADAMCAAAIGGIECASEEGFSKRICEDGGGVETDAHKGQSIFDKG